MQTVVAFRYPAIVYSGLLESLENGGGRVITELCIPYLGLIINADGFVFKGASEPRVRECFRSRVEVVRLSEGQVMRIHEFVAIRFNCGGNLPLPRNLWRIFGILETRHHHRTHRRRVEVSR